MSPQEPAQGRPATLPVRQNPAPTLFSRYEHGEVPVIEKDPTQRGCRGSYEVQWGQSYDATLRQLGTVLYLSAGKLLLALFNRGRIDGPGLKTPRMSFDHYFRLDVAPTVGGALALFGGSEARPTPAPVRQARPPTRQAHPNTNPRWSRPARSAGVVVTTVALFGALTVVSAQAEVITEDLPREATEEVRLKETSTVAIWVTEGDLPASEVSARPASLPAAPRGNVPPSADTKSEKTPNWSKLTVQAPQVEAPIAVPTPLVVEAPAALQVAPALVAPEPEAAPLGIDLAARGHEVKKLLHAGFGLKMAARGYDTDDVLQEVYRGLLARNNGKCPFDARKSSFGHYVHMVCDCVLKNYHRKQARIRSHERTGLMAPASVSGVRDAGGWTEVDAALVADTGTNGFVANRSHDPSLGVSESMARSSLTGWLIHSSQEALINEKNERKANEYRMAADVMPLKALGMTRAEISSRLDLSLGQVSKALSRLREGSMEWAVSQGLR
ncbi:hypothetical protein N9917_00275 [Deltaproteobacteria bacterium]|nr:hypothetical protein [Deltaproteobacteria bacterium]